MAKPKFSKTPKKGVASVASTKDSDESPKRSRAPLVIGVIVALLVIVGSIAWVLQPKSDLTYQTFVFKEGNCPGTEKTCYFASLTINNQPYEIPFEHHPKTVENILFEYPVLEYLRATLKQQEPTAIITIPKNSPASIGISAAQLGRILGDRYGLLNMNVLAREAGTGEDEADCRYATQKQYVIMFEQRAPSGVFLRAPNCIVVQAETNEELGAVVDAYVYRILGIIPTQRGSSTPKSLPAPPRGVVVVANNSNLSNNSLI